MRKISQLFICLTSLFGILIVILFLSSAQVAANDKMPSGGSRPKLLRPLFQTSGCEQHDFGSPSIQINVYADGRTWDFEAENDMTVGSIETRSVLADNPSLLDNTFHIEVQINGSPVVSWTQEVTSTQYQPYTHTATVSTTLHVSDTITYRIYGGTMGTAVGGISGVNHVKLCQKGATTWVVTTTADSGYGSLRWAIESAVMSDTITFDPTVFPPTTPATITLSSALPEISQGNLTIDGSGAGVILDGSSLSSGDGFDIRSDDNLVKGLQILNFPGSGVTIFNGASHNTVSDNVINGNGDRGIFISGAGTMSNTVIGNLIGTDATGAAAMGNSVGVSIHDGAQYNIVGGDTSDKRNLISGNQAFDLGDGVDINNASHNSVIGNYIGTNINGTAAISNGASGVGMCCGASFNYIGGATANERNLISGNSGDGVGLWGSGSDHNVISGNYIGTDINGIIAIPNRRHC